MVSMTYFKLALGLGLAITSVACSDSKSGTSMAAQGGSGATPLGNAGASAGGTSTGTGNATSSTGNTSGTGTTVGAGGAGSIPACTKGATFSCAGLDLTKTLGSATAADIATGCDCMSAYYGGYGVTKTCTCNGVTQDNQGPKDAATCGTTFKPDPSCTWTYGDYVKCMNAIWADPCNATAATNEPACQGALIAGCKIGN